MLGLFFPDPDNIGFQVGEADIQPFAVEKNARRVPVILHNIQINGAAANRGNFRFAVGLLYNPLLNCRL